MPEAIAAVVKITLRHPTIYRMAATCDVENKASARALEKSGFSPEAFYGGTQFTQVSPLSLVISCSIRMPGVSVAFSFRDPGIVPIERSPHDAGTR